LIKTADHLARSERKLRLLVPDHLEHLLVADLLHPLNRPIDALEIGANIGSAVPERAIENGPANVACLSPVPNLLDGSFAHVSDRCRDPALTTEEDVTTTPPTAEHLEPREWL
jgi:hypothetical protein